MRDLLAAGGLSQDAWMNEYLDAELTQELFKGLVEATRADSTSAGIGIALKPFTRPVVVASGATRVASWALGYAPLCGVERVLQGWLDRLNPRDSWQAIASTLVQAIKDDVAAVQSIVTEIGGMIEDLGIDVVQAVERGEGPGTALPDDERFKERTRKLERRIQQSRAALADFRELGELKIVLSEVRETVREVRGIARDVKTVQDVRKLLEASTGLCTLALGYCRDVDFTHAITTLQRFRLNADASDWKSSLRGLKAFEQSKPIYQAFVAARTMWLIAQLADASVTERAHLLKELGRECSELSDFELAGAANAITAVLPLLPDLLEARHHIASPQADSWLEWAGKLADALAGSEVAVIKRLRDRLERQTEEWILGRLHQTMTALLGRSLSQRVASPSMLAGIAPLNRAWAVNVSLSGHVAERGIYLIDGKRYIEDRECVYRVRYKADEDAWCVVPNERIEERAAWRQLEFISGRWWLRPRVARPGCVPALTTKGDPAVERASDFVDPDLDNLVYRDTDGNLRMRDFLATGSSVESSGSGWKLWAGGAGLSIGLALLLTLFSVWRAGRAGDKRNPEKGREGERSVASETLLPPQPIKSIALDIPKASADGVGTCAGACDRSGNAKLLLLGSFATVLTAGSAWALATASDEKVHKPDIFDDDSLSAIEPPSELPHRIVINAPSDLFEAISEPSTPGKDPSAQQFLSRTQRRSRRSVHATGVVPEFWAMPADSSVDAKLEAAVANTFGGAHAYAPKDENILPIEDKLYRGERTNQKLIFADGHYWPCTAFGDYAFQSGADAQDSRDLMFPQTNTWRTRDAVMSAGTKRLFIVFDGSDWKLKPGANTKVDTSIAPRPVRVDDGVVDIAKRWDKKWSYQSYRAAGFEGRLYRDAAKNEFMYIAGRFWHCVAFHPRLIELRGGFATYADKLYLIWSGSDWIWKQGEIVMPSHLPADILTKTLKKDIEEKCTFESEVEAKNQGKFPGLYTASTATTYSSKPKNYLKAGSRFYECVVTSMVPCDGTDGERFEKTVALRLKDRSKQFIYAAWDSGLGRWQRVENGATNCVPEFDLRHRSTQGQFAQKNTVAADSLLSEKLDVDPAGALQSVDIARPKKSGGLYQEGRKLYIYLQQEFWPLVMLSPILGVVYAGRKAAQSHLLICVDGIWKPVTFGVKVENVYHVLQSLRLTELSEWPESRIADAGFMTWSQRLMTFEEDADRAIAENMGNPDNQALKIALTRKSLVWFLKRISLPDKQWSFEKPTSQMLSNDLMIQVASELGREGEENEVEIGHAYDVCNTTDADFQSELDGLDQRIEKTEAEITAAKSHVLPQEQARSDPTFCATGPNTEALILWLFSEAVNSAQETLAKDNWWVIELNRLVRLQDRLKCRRSELSAEQERIRDNGYVTGFRRGRLREKAELEKNSPSGGFGRKLRQGLVYSRIIADLDWQILATWGRVPRGIESDGAREAEIGNLLNARLYIFRQWKSADDFADVLYELEQIDEQEHSVTLECTYQDILRCNKKAESLIEAFLPSTGFQLSHREVVASVLLWVNEEKAPVSSIAATDFAAISKHYSDRSKALHLLSNIRRVPGDYKSLIHIRPSSLCADESEYFAQFDNYVRDSLSYDAAWMTTTLLLPLGLEAADFFSIGKALHVKYKTDKTDEYYARLANGDWVMAAVGENITNIRSKKLAGAQAASYLDKDYGAWEFIDKTPASDGWSTHSILTRAMVCDDTRVSSCFNRVPVVKMEDLSREALKGTAASNIAVYFRQEFEGLIQNRISPLKMTLHKPSFAMRMLFELVPFARIGYLGSFGVNPSAADVVIDVISVLSSVYPAFKGVGSVVSRGALRQSVRSGRAFGLSGKRLLSHIILVTERQKVVGDAVKIFKVIAAGLFDMVVPTAIDVADIGREVKAKPLVRARMQASLYLPDNFNERAIQLDSYFQRARFQESSLVFNASNQTFQMRRSAGISDDAEFIKVGENYCRVGFDWKDNSYYVIYPEPDNPRRGPSVKFTSDGWIGVPAPTPKCSVFRTRSIRFVADDVLPETSREMLEVVQRGRSKAFKMLEYAGKMLSDQRDYPAVARLFRIFTGTDGADVIDAFFEEILISLMGGLSNVRAFTNVQYWKKSGTSVFVTNYPGRPPLSALGGDFGFDFDSKDTTWLLRATEEGFDRVASMGAQFDDVIARMLIHEGFHMTLVDDVEIYSMKRGARNTVESLVTNAGDKLKGISVNTLASDAKHKQVVLQTLKFAVIKDSTAPHAWKYRNVDPGTNELLDGPALEALYANKTKVRNQLDEINRNYAGRMKGNADSVSYVVLGLAYLRKDLKALDDFFSRYEKFMSGELDSLEWVYRPLK
jgi:hypothetical protein